jgi:vancomycin resistance protein VanJ
MTDSAHPASAGEFWRCGKCGIPNPARSYLTNCLGCGAVRPADSTAERPRGKSRERVKTDPGIVPDAGASAPGRTLRDRFGGWVLAVTWAYAVLVLATLILIRWVGEKWWGVTLLLFLPRWLFLGPIPALALASGLMRRFSYWAVQGAVALVVAGPLMGASLPVHQLWRRPVEGERFRLLNFNRGLRPLDGPALVDLIEREKIDLICFQEGFRPNPKLEAHLSTGWYRDRKKFLASRYPIVAEIEMRPLADDSMPEGQHACHLTRVRVRAPSGREFWLASTHLPTLRPGLNRFLEGDVGGLKLHIDWWRREMGRVVNGLTEIGDRPFLVGGDFNMPPDDATMAGLRSVCRFGFEEAGWGYGYTRPTRSPWFRIDHILASPQWVFTRCWVGPDLGSDHLPLLAEVFLPAPPRPESVPAR